MLFPAAGRTFTAAAVIQATPGAPNAPLGRHLVLGGVRWHISLAQPGEKGRTKAGHLRQPALPGTPTAAPPHGAGSLGEAEPPGLAAPAGGRRYPPCGQGKHRRTTSVAAADPRRQRGLRSGEERQKAGSKRRSASGRRDPCPAPSRRYKTQASSVSHQGARRSGSTLNKFHLQRPLPQAVLSGAVSSHCIKGGGELHLTNVRGGKITPEIAASFSA